MSYLKKLIARSRRVHLLPLFGLLIVCATLSFTLSTTVSAQSKSVFGGNSIARECYQASIVAAQTGFSSRTDLETCDEALFYGSLSSKDKVATYVNRGIIKVALQDYVSGVKDYETAIRLDPDSAEAYLNRGNLWFMAKKYQEAIDDYNRSIDLEVRKEQVAILNIGLSYEYLKQYETAKKYYEAALEKAPEWSLALEKLDRVNNTLEKGPAIE